MPCGSGAFVRRLLEAGSYEVFAADKAAHPAVPAEAVFQAADMDEPLPYPTGQFDALVCIEGIEHIRRPFDFIRECARVVRPGGWLFLTTPNISSLRSRWRWFLTGFHHKASAPLDEAHPQLRHHVNMRACHELRYMLHTSGFQVCHVTTNRIKPVNWLYLPWAPVQWLASWYAFRGAAKNEAHRMQIIEVARQMRGPAVLFGEALIIQARRTAEASSPGPEPPGHRVDCPAAGAHQQTDSAAHIE